MSDPRDPSRADHPELARRLEAVARPTIDVPSEVDARVLAIARQRLDAAQQAPRHGRTVRTWWSIAAMMAVACTIGVFVFTASQRRSAPGIVSHAVQADILQVFALARDMQSGIRPSDPQAIDRMAHEIVRLRRTSPPPVSRPDAPRLPGGDVDAVRFSTVKVLLRAERDKLAAYQLRLVFKGGAQVVGIEAGDGVFAEQPPYYDRLALNNAETDEIVLAMFTTAAPDQIAIGAVRVATLHIMTRGQAAPELDATLQAAADPVGQRIAATVRCIEESSP